MVDQAECRRWQSYGLSGLARNRSSDRLYVSWSVCERDYFAFVFYPQCSAARPRYLATVHSRVNSRQNTSGRSFSRVTTTNTAGAATLNRNVALVIGEPLAYRRLTNSRYRGIRNKFIMEMSNRDPYPFPRLQNDDNFLGATSTQQVSFYLALGNAGLIGLSSDTNIGMG